MLIRLLFFEKLHFPQVDLSWVRASSEVQTQTNCYMYAILLPVISAPDLTSYGQTEVSVLVVIGGFRSSAFVSFFAFAVCLF